MLQAILNSTLEVVRMSRNERTRFLGTFSLIVEDVFRRIKVVYPIRLAEKYNASNMNDLGSIFKGVGLKLHEQMLYILPNTVISIAYDVLWFHSA